MKIDVNYLESEVVKDDNVSRRKVKKNGNKSNAIMISITTGSDGIDYCHIVLETGIVKKVALDLVEVVEKSYLK